MASSRKGTDSNEISPNLGKLFQSIQRAPVPFFRFGKSQSPPTLNAGINTLLATSINSRKLLDNSSYHQFLTAKQASDVGIEPRFLSLKNIVEHISDTLLQGRKATAEFEAICIQSKASTLTTHQHVLSRNGHIALLYVVATGDWNAESESSFIVKRSEEMYRGEVYGPGAYAACFPSDLMVLNTANSSEESFRVTIIYSIFILEPMGESNGKPCRTNESPWINQSQCYLSQLTPDVGGIIISFLGVREMRNLALSCKHFREITQVEEIITKSMMECKDEFLRCQYVNKNGTDTYDLAIPLQWSYFTYHDQYNNNCEDYWLFGLDYVIYKAIQKAFENWELKCRKTVIRCVDGRINNSNLQIVQATVGWESNYEDISEPLDLVFPLGKIWTSETWDAILYLSNYLQSASEDEAFLLWPFFFTRFVIGKTYFRGILNRLVPYSRLEFENERYSVLCRSSCVLLSTKTPSTMQIQERGIKNEELWIAPVWIDD